MQATVGTVPSDRSALTRDMYALASYLMRSSNVGAFNTIAELELSFTQIKALCAMDLDNEDRSVKALADSMKVSLPAMSRAIDGLYARGFVDREEDPVDRRMKRVRLTESGRAITSSLNESRLAAMQEFLVSLSDDEAQALTRALGLILASRGEIAALRPRQERVTT
jgi:DNA-binding MarR family transcriptional regulator